MSRTVQLTLLDRIEIAAPCSAAWEDMEGDERSRFCGQCRLNVYNIAAMTRDEAESLILAKEGRVCARIFRRADGTILTRDCPVGLRAARARLAAGLARLGAASALIVGSLLSFAGARAAGIRARDVQPFASICRWIYPASAPPMAGRIVMGDVAPMRPPVAAPAPASNPGGR